MQSETSGTYDDPFDLARFLSAQESCYPQALAEVQHGEKRTHWMWFIFPQLRGLGSSPTARLYGISGIGEAEAYLAHPVLGPRLVECCEAALSVQGRTATEIFGSPDDMKLCSCATLFAQVAGSASVYQRILDKYFGGRSDDRTLQLLA
ncbi:DUF1810 domain-containing protein [Stieleria mannarensis]|uniref:DUF1810 domain-containing protein n=1 Tax=Stieleria mannarensis TaxID=2755585 RepID=UPI0015FFF8A4|nr:DUF1810 domain-containing protein [Rhodopirellula sp. JC639]